MYCYGTTAGDSNFLVLGTLHVQQKNWNVWNVEVGSVCLDNWVAFTLSFRKENVTNTCAVISSGTVN
jgi:hypothetical protein